MWTGSGKGRADGGVGERIAWTLEREACMGSGEARAAWICSQQVAGGVDREWESGSRERGSGRAGAADPGAGVMDKRAARRGWGCGRQGQCGQREAGSGWCRPRVGGVEPGAGDVDRIVGKRAV